MNKTLWDGDYISPDDIIVIYRTTKDGYATLKGSTILISPVELRGQQMLTVRRHANRKIEICQTTDIISHKTSINNELVTIRCIAKYQDCPVKNTCKDCPEQRDDGSCLYTKMIYILDYVIKYCIYVSTIS